MLHKNLLSWYSRNKRQLPWRGETDPYKVWISEVILQQTRIEQGRGYYIRFIEQFPTVKSLANANEDEVLKYWQGLGYYNRALNLHKGAKQIIDDLNGVFPTTSMGLKNIRGIGDYTAAAIASMVFNEPVAAIDGNLKRILARIGAIEIPFETKAFLEAANKELQLVFDFGQPGESNQALMDLGSMICTPRKPKCHDCPLSSGCLSLVRQNQELLPVKKKQKPKTDRHFWYMVNDNPNALALYKRNSGDIWAGLYESPSIETSSADIREFFQILKTQFGIENLAIKNVTPCIKPHILSHQQIFYTFVQTDNDLSFYPCSKYFNISELPAMHVLMQKFTQRFLRQNKH
jgi:A/G-specific adenine glycosylase